jgi:hypothetical protein
MPILKKGNKPMKKMNPKVKNILLSALFVALTFTLVFIVVYTVEVSASSWVDYRLKYAPSHITPGERFSILLVSTGVTATILYKLTK